MPYCRLTKSTVHNYNIPIWTERWRYPMPKSTHPFMFTMDQKNPSRILNPHNNGSHISAFQTYTYIFIMSIRAVCNAHKRQRNSLQTSAWHEKNSLAKVELCLCVHAVDVASMRIAFQPELSDSLQHVAVSLRWRCHTLNKGWLACATVSRHRTWLQMTSRMLRRSKKNKKANNSRKFFGGKKWRKTRRNTKKKKNTPMFSLFHIAQNGTEKGKRMHCAHRNTGKKQPKMSMTCSKPEKIPYKHTHTHSELISLDSFLARSVARLKSPHIDMPDNEHPWWFRDWAMLYCCIIVHGL